MTLEEHLSRIEDGFWPAGEDHLCTWTRDALAFPQAGEMHGIHSRKEVGATTTIFKRWRELQITQRYFLQTTGHVAILSYRADVERADGQPYSALVSLTHI